MLLAGKVCVLSGVGPGMGQAMARAVAREGGALVLAARRAEVVTAVAEEIISTGGRALACPTDVTDSEQCRALVSAAVDHFGGVDVLVNNAYKPDVFQRFESVDLDEWRSILDVNVFGNLQLTQAVVEPMKERGGGSIVFVNSMIVRKPLARQGGYAASKAALLTAAQVLAVELGPYGIRVNSLLPGWMWGPQVQAYTEWTAGRRGVAAADVRAEIAARIPLGDIPTQEACAEAVLFLASDLSAAVTGQGLDVNGGEAFH